MTHSSIDRADLYDEVKSFVAAYLCDAADIRVSDDDDGETRFIRVTVLVHGSTADYVRSKPTGLLRLLRAKLLGWGVDAYPSISFVAFSEAQAA